MSDVFISYSRSTAKAAQRIADALRALGYAVWRDEQIPAHRAYADVIEERLLAAKAVLVVWSAEAAKSEWVRSEAERARAAHKLIQLTIDGAKLPMPFDQIECANLVGWTAGSDTPGWRKVVASVAELTGTRVDLGRAADFQLGGVLVSPSALRMHGPDGELRVEPKVMEVLVVLARNAGRTVTRDQLIDACWDGRIVSDDAVSRVIAQVRALARNIDPPPFELETVPKVGFRLMTAAGGDSPTQAAASLQPRAGASLWRRPTVLIAALVLVAAVTVTLVVRGQAPRPIAPWSDQDPRMTFALGPVASPPGDPTLASYGDQFARALRARFSPALGDARLLADTTRGVAPARYGIGLEVRRDGPGVVTRVTLVARADGAVLGVREVSDALGAAASAPAVWHASDLIKTTALRHDAGLAAAKPPREQDARDLLIMAIAAPIDRSHNAQAIGWLERAERLAPHQVMVTKALVSELDERAANGWSDPASATADVLRIGVLARRLMRDNPDDPAGPQMLADSYLMQGRWADARVAVERLLKIKPDDAWAFVIACRAQIGQGDFAGAQATVDRLQAFQNSKVEWDTAELAGLLRFHQGRYGEAATNLRRAVQLTAPDDLGRPAFAGLRLYLAAAEAADGRLPQARADLADFRAAAPAVRGPADFRRWNDGVRLPLIDWDRLAGGLAKIGWTDAVG